MARTTPATASSSSNARSRCVPCPGRSTEMHRYRSTRASIWGRHTDRPISAPWTNTIGEASGGPTTSQVMASPATASRVIARPGRSARLGPHLSPRAAEADRGEGDPELAERLDRDQEAGEKEHHREELRDGERARDAEPVERVAGGRHEPADRDEQGRGHA